MGAISTEKGFSLPEMIPFIDAAQFTGEAFMVERGNILQHAGHALTEIRDGPWIKPHGPAQHGAQPAGEVRPADIIGTA